YCNLLNEKWAEQSQLERDHYGPYLPPSDTAQQYGEGRIDPQGQGWMRNLGDQFLKAQQYGFQFVELDNPDSYPQSAVIDAIARAHRSNLRVIAKNPLQCDWPSIDYVYISWGI